MPRMDLLDRLLGHDAWTTRQLLSRCDHFSDEQLDRTFPIGHGSLRATFEHTIWNIEVWTDLMCERAVRQNPGPADMTIPAMTRRLDATAAEFAELARRLTRDGRLDHLFADTVETPNVMYTFGGGIAHVITHSMHHRAQVLNMMRHLGITDLIEGDTLTWEGEHRPGGWERRPPR